MGGAALEEWVDGELEARRRSGERRRCFGVWGRGNSAIVSGIGRGDPPGSDARERKGNWDSIRAFHGDEDVVAGGGLWARGKERRAPALRQGQWRRSGATRGRPAQAGGGLPAGLERRRQGKQRSRQEEGEAGPNCNFKKFRDPTVKQR